MTQLLNSLPKALCGNVTLLRVKVRIAHPNPSWKSTKRAWNNRDTEILDKLASHVLITRLEPLGQLSHDVHGTGTTHDLWQRIESFQNRLATNIQCLDSLQYPFSSSLQSSQCRDLRYTGGTNRNSVLHLHHLVVQVRILLREDNIPTSIARHRISLAKTKEMHHMFIFKTSETSLIGGNVIKVFIGAIENQPLLMLSAQINGSL
mmetsp:Transcript_19915/g.34003  ORF Transcript_19915/g.34003 Transcript_19915/m.34003 type:complete len:205 (-) Transcript_19915:505-1119(-)